MERIMTNRSGQSQDSGTGRLKIAEDLLIRGMAFRGPVFGLTDMISTVLQRLLEGGEVAGAGDEDPLYSEEIPSRPVGSLLGRKQGGIPGLFGDVDQRIVVPSDRPSEAGDFFIQFFFEEFL